MKARELIAKNWKVRIQHVFRKANATTDWLANYDLIKNPINKDNWIIQNPLSGLFLTLYYDFIRFTLSQIWHKDRYQPIDLQSPRAVPKKQFETKNLSHIVLPEESIC
jgi:hypothetical protein